MPIEIDKVQEYTGIKAETTEEFIEQFGKKFYTEDQVFKDEETKKKFFGRAFGSATTGVKQLFDSHGIEITGDDLKQPIEAVVKTGMSKLQEKFNAEKAELERTAGLTADDKIKEISENYNKAQAKLKDYDRIFKEKAAEIEALTTNSKNEMKKFKLKSVYEAAENSIPWNPEVNADEYKKKGFLVAMREKYNVDLEDNDDDFIVDRATNTRVKSEGSHSAFMRTKDVYLMEATKAGLAAVNKKSGQPAPIQKNNTTFTPPANPAPTGPQPFKKQIANTGWKRPQ